MKKMIGILGGREENCSDAAKRLARAVGAEIAKRGMAVVCGGGDGIMEEACRGCREAGGVALGIMKWNHATDANPHIDYAIATSMDLARNNVIIWSAAGLIAFDGGYGTASETSLALDVGRPLIVTGDAPLLQERAFEAESCVVLPGNEPADAARILDMLEHIIARSDLLKDARKE